MKVFGCYSNASNHKRAYVLSLPQSCGSGRLHKAAMLLRPPQNCRAEGLRHFTDTKLMLCFTIVSFLCKKWLTRAALLIIVKRRQGVRQEVIANKSGRSISIHVLERSLPRPWARQLCYDLHIAESHQVGWGSSYPQRHR